MVRLSCDHMRLLSNAGVKHVRRLYLLRLAFYIYTKDTQGSVCVWEDQVCSLGLVFNWLMNLAHRLNCISSLHFLLNMDTGDVLILLRFTTLESTCGLLSKCCQSLAVGRAYRVTIDISCSKLLNYYQFRAPIWKTWQDNQTIWMGDSKPGSDYNFLHEVIWVVMRKVSN